MFDKVLFNKICSLECSLNELKSFFDGIENRKFDTDSPFKKYYSFDLIKEALDRYKSGEISCEYLRYWTNAYNLIIKGGFFSAEIIDEDEMTQAQFAESEISSLLDSLSFIDEPEKSEIDYYLELFLTYNGMLKE